MSYIVICLQRCVHGLLSKNFKDLPHAAAQWHDPIACLPVDSENRGRNKICAGLPEVVVDEWLKQEIVIRLGATAAQRPDVVDQASVYPWTLDTQSNGSGAEAPER